MIRVPPGRCLRAGPARVTRHERTHVGHAGIRRHGQLGQSLAEFAIVVPLLLTLFIAVADFGRIFATMISVEAATRDAAEAVANEYLAHPPAALDTPAPAGNTTYYDNLHRQGAQVVCSELRGQPNTNFDSGSNTCPDMPVVVVCIHDGQDLGCTNAAQPGTGGIPSECTDFSPPASTDQGGTSKRWVEVRTCYHYTAILDLPFFPLHDFWIQRIRSFTIPCYFVLGTSECG